MISSDFKQIARRKLDGKWGTAIGMILVYMLTFFVIGLVQGLLPEGSLVSSIISIIVYAIEIPLAFGFIFAFFKLFYGEDVKVFSFWSLGFDNFGRSWGIAFRTLLKLIVPFILMIVSYALLIGSVFSMSASAIMLESSSTAVSGALMIVGFVLLIISAIWMTVKSYYYSLAQCVAFDNPNLTPKECVEKSKELMTNRRGKLFCLQFSFVGWAILAAFTFGIAYLWLLPYMQMSIIAFYDAFAHDGKVEAEVIEEN